MIVSDQLKVIELIKKNSNSFPYNSPDNVARRLVGTLLISKIEDFIAQKKNPILIIPERSVGTFMASSGNLHRNPYALRLHERKYYFYHKFIDVEIIDLNHNELREDIFLVVERDQSNNLVMDDWFAFVAV